jgi:hypothetical protein
MFRFHVYLWDVTVAGGPFQLAPGLRLFGLYRGLHVLVR